MRTALAVLAEKKAEITRLNDQEASNPELDEKRELEALMRWVNFLEAQLLMATADAMCLIEDPEPQNWGKRLEGALGRAAARLISLGEPVPAKKLELKS